MKKAIAVVLIVMIEVATRMPVLMALNLPSPPATPAKCTLDAVKPVLICLVAYCTAKLLNLNILVPLALQLIVACGMTPPPSFTCPDN
ncbi:hypothetical protein SUGI_0472490 [Cryptomeria japonica]|nr:hypothetical protein SUGI_0472490 [Cryptomeria japonica]